MIEDIEKNLAVSFSENPIFDENNIGKDNTFEDKTVTFIVKLNKYFNIQFNNLYEKLRSFNFKPLSIYSNKGFVDYDPLENIGYISLTSLKDDPEDDFNIDNLFSQLLLMITTSKDNYYGFGNSSLLNSLNRACTYMIASNISSSSSKNFLEEELIALNLLSITLEGVKSKIDFINSYFSNNGALLKQELNINGINDDILNEINYLSQAKMSKLNMPEQFAKILNRINKNFASLISSGKITSHDIISKYESNLVNDQVFDYSHSNVTKVNDNMQKALLYLEEEKSLDKKVMYKTA